MPPMSLTGVVTKVGLMNKTATVTVSRFVMHKLTGKRIERTKKYKTHDEHNQLQHEDVVLIRNCPPKSATKHFKLEKVLKSPETERAQRREREAALLASATTLPSEATPSPSSHPQPCASFS